MGKIKMKQKTRKLKGYIRWFDMERGEGAVRLRSGESVSLHFTSIQGWDQSNWVYPSKKDQNRAPIKNKDCEVVVYANSISIKSVKLLPTKQNAKKWFSERYDKCECCDQYIGLSKNEVSE